MSVGYLSISRVFYSNSGGEICEFYVRMIFSFRATCVLSFSMNNQLMEGVHGHDFDELVIVRSGSGFHIINDLVRFICQGDFF